MPTVIRGVLGLSAGTAVARGLSAVGQILLAIWLSPAEFGYWAAATSALSLLSGLVNFGEVNGYLSGQGADLKGVQSVTRRQNALLAALGLGIAGAYALSGNGEVAILVVVAALTLPLTGSAELMYAAGVKVKVYRKVVAAQSVGAVLKILTGVGIAAVWHSSMALAVSTAVFYVVMDLLIRAWVGREAWTAPAAGGEVDGRIRAKWAVNSLSMSMPLQVGFLVAQFLSSPAILGIYYFAYQITLGISGLVSVPLARVSLSTLGGSAGQERLELARRLSTLFGAGMITLAALATAAAPLAESLVTERWALVVPATVVLLASLPARMMSPVVDAFQQAENRWWQSTAFNCADIVGTALVALTIISGDVIVLVLSLTAWKVVLSLTRTFLVFRQMTLVERLSLTAPVMLSSVLLCLASVDVAGLQTVWSALALVIGLSWGLSARSKGRS